MAGTFSPEAASNRHACGEEAGLCMCQVCDCGAHRCPKVSNVHYDPNLKSEYIKKFPEWPIAKRDPYRPPESKSDDGPLSDITTYNTDYVKWPAMKRSLMRPPPKALSSGGFKDDTTYKVDYWDKSKMSRPTRRVESPARLESGPFYKETTYGVGYCPKPLNPKMPPLKHPSSLGPSGAPFDGETTYHERFKAWETRVPKRGQGYSGGLKCEGSFNPETTYHHDYIRPPPVKRCHALLLPRPSVYSKGHFHY